MKLTNRTRGVIATTMIVGGSVLGVVGFATPSFAAAGPTNITSEYCNSTPMHQAGESKRICTGTYVVTSANVQWTQAEIGACPRIGARFDITLTYLTYQGTSFLAAVSVFN